MSVLKLDKIDNDNWSVIKNLEENNKVAIDKNTNCLVSKKNREGLVSATQRLIGGGISTARQETLEPRVSLVCRTVAHVQVKAQERLNKIKQKKETFNATKFSSIAQAKNNSGEIMRELSQHHSNLVDLHREIQRGIRGVEVFKTTYNVHGRLTEPMLQQLDGSVDPQNGLKSLLSQCEEEISSVLQERDKLHFYSKGVYDYDIEMMFKKIGVELKAGRTTVAQQFTDEVLAKLKERGTEEHWSRAMNICKAAGDEVMSQRLQKERNEIEQSLDQFIAKLPRSQPAG